MTLCYIQHLIPEKKHTENYVKQPGAVLLFWLKNEKNLNWTIYETVNRNVAAEYLKMFL